MLVHGGVPRTFGGTGTAKGDAGGELGFLKLAMTGLVGPGDDMAGGGANRRAVEIETNAGDQFFDMLFRKAGIGAGGAGLNTGETGVDATTDRARLADLLRVRMKQGADRGHRAISFNFKPFQRTLGQP